MFDGNEQFHQFIASSRSTSLPLSLPFPLHGNPSFDSYAAPPPPPPQLHPSAAAAAKNNINDEDISTNLALERERSTDPWSNDELLALLKVRSSMELWFPDFNWEHVSRKLGELGYKRSGDQCKDKFEEESRHFNNSKNYRILSELDEFYQPPPPISTAQEEVDQRKLVVVPPQMNKKVEEIIMKPSSVDHIREEEMATKKSSRKRKRKDKLEMLKGFCEAVVKKMMAKQEELHNKLIQDIIKMDQDKIAREEAWKNREMDRIKTEIETRSKDHKSAAERQATIIQFLKHFTSDHDQQQHMIFKNKNCSNSNSNSCASFPQTHNHHDQDHEDVVTPPPPPPPSTMLYQNPPPPSSPSNTAKDSTPPPLCLSEGGGGDDIGKRWPRDEVVALINLRCKMSGGGGGGGGDQESSSSGGGGGGKEGARGPLWERISVGMGELGYKRSAKRCKEKWENINKYFRKTKDSSKKRSLNSRTCPYFHHLTSLYGDGTIVAPTVNGAAAAVPEM